LGAFDARSIEFLIGSVDLLSRGTGADECQHSGPEQQWCRACFSE
jgi:hypothetical protein